MFGLGDTEFLLIIIFAFLLFGPDKLPSMGRTIGRGIRQFRQASDSVTKVVKTEVLNPLSDAAKTEAGTPAMSNGSSALEAPQPVERPTETFAERRARLAREREERATAAAEAAVASEAVAGSEVGSVETPDPIETGAVGQTVEVAAPARAASVASMWGLDDETPDATGAETGEEDATVTTA